MTIDICLPICSDTAMSFTQDLLAAIKKAHRERFGGVDLAMAKAAGCDPTGLGKLLKKTDLPKFQTVGKLAELAGLRLVADDQPKEDEYAFIPRALAKPAAGGGSLETSGETEGALAFRREWISRKTRTSPERLRVMVVSGDSMSPTIDDEDIVLVDEGCQGGELKEGRVYVIRKGEEIFVKRFRKGVGCLLFMGDNRGRDYLDVEVKEGDEDGFRVIGRVLWAGKEL